MRTILLFLALCNFNCVIHSMEHPMGIDDSRNDYDYLNNLPSDELISNDNRWVMQNFSNIYNGISFINNYGSPIGTNCKPIYQSKYTNTENLRVEEENVEIKGLNEQLQIIVISSLPIINDYTTAIKNTLEDIRDLNSSYRTNSSKFIQTEKDKYLQELQEQRNRSFKFHIQLHTLLEDYRKAISQQDLSHPFLCSVRLCKLLSGVTNILDIFDKGNTESRINNLYRMIGKTATIAQHIGKKTGNFIQESETQKLVNRVYELITGFNFYATLIKEKQKQLCALTCEISCRISSEIILTMQKEHNANMYSQSRYLRNQLCLMVQLNPESNNINDLYIAELYITIGKICTIEQFYKYASMAEQAQLTKQQADKNNT